MDGGTDYSATAPTITITAGDRMGTATLSIAPTDDDVVEDDETIEVSGTATGWFRGTVASVTVTLTDNDTAGITVDPTTGLTTTEAGGTAMFTVVLDSQPTADVSIGVRSSDTGEGTVSTDMLTFTATTWNNAPTGDGDGGG